LQQLQQPAGAHITIHPLLARVDQVSWMALPILCHHGRHLVAMLASILQDIKVVVAEVGCGQHLLVAAGVVETEANMRQW
jgi:hypothetical protein